MKLGEKTDQERGGQRWRPQVSSREDVPGGRSLCCGGGGILLVWMILLNVLFREGLRGGKETSICLLRQSLLLYLSVCESFGVQAVIMVFKEKGCFLDMSPGGSLI